MLIPSHTALIPKRQCCFHPVPYQYLSDKSVDVPTKHNDNEGVAATLLYSRVAATYRVLHSP